MHGYDGWVRTPGPRPAAGSRSVSKGSAHDRSERWIVAFLMTSDATRLADFLTGYHR
jgi:hypothetical protein